MMACKQCGSQAINHHCHGRDGTRPDLCDVCFWRVKYKSSKRKRSGSRLRLNRRMAMPCLFAAEPSAAIARHASFTIVNLMASILLAGIIGIRTIGPASAITTISTGCRYRSQK